MGYVNFDIDHSEIPDSMSPEHLRSEIRERSERIFGDRETLKKIIARHEAAIHKRWLKKTKNQRRDILLQAWPGMATSHRPDFAAWRLEPEAPEHSYKPPDETREACLWPYINLEDLTKPKSLLPLLRSRAKHHPDAFACVDWNAAHFGYAVGRVCFGSLHKHTMVFMGRKDVESYGELISWNENNQAEEWLMSGRGMYPGYGMVVLETQQRIWQFLVKCARIILHDRSEDDLTSDAYPLQPEPALEIGTVDGFAAQAVMAAEAPYLPPANLNLATLEAMLAAKVSAAEDHIFSLREDPSYLASTLHESEEHLPQMIPWIGGGRDPLHKTQDATWQKVIKGVVTTAYMNFGIWIEVHALVKEVQELQAKHAYDICAEKDLPAEYQYAIHKLLHTLNTFMGIHVELLVVAIPASPQLRARFARTEGSQDASCIVELPIEGHDGQAQLLWLLREMRRKGDLVQYCGLNVLMDELERLLSADPEAKALLSGHVARVLSDLAIFVACLRQLDLYQPWAATYDKTITLANRNSIVTSFGAYTKGLSKILGTSTVWNREIFQLGDPRNDKFYYPAHKRRTKENVDRLRRAEENLDAFWTAIDKKIRAAAGDQVDDTKTARLFHRPTVWQRTPAWEEEKQNGKPIPALPNSKMSLAELSFQLEHLTERTIDSDRTPIKVKTKSKTRGLPAVMAARPDGVEAMPGVVQPRVGESKDASLTVDARAHKVFRTVFHTPTANAEPGAIAWKEFLHAMASLGFAPEKLYGSVWQFSPRSIDLARSIHFHEPHPDGKLQYFQARRIGRRLSRAYGWTGETFQLKSKVSA